MFLIKFNPTCWHLPIELRPTSENTSNWSNSLMDFIVTFCVRQFAKQRIGGVIWLINNDLSLLLIDASLNRRNLSIFLSSPNDFLHSWPTQQKVIVQANFSRLLMTLRVFLDARKIIFRSLSRSTAHNRPSNCTLFMFYLHIYGNWKAMLCIPNKCKSLQKKRRNPFSIHRDCKLCNSIARHVNLTLFCVRHRVSAICMTI